MTLSYVEQYITANIKINAANDKQKMKLTKQIIKLGEWAQEDLRRMKDGNKRAS
jgi:hypothetical protein